MEIVNNSFSESKKNLFDKAENVQIEKNKDIKTKYLSYSKYSIGTIFWLVNAFSN